MFKIHFYYCQCCWLDFFYLDRFYFNTLASVRIQESERPRHRKSNTISRGFVGVMKTQTFMYIYIYIHMNHLRANLHTD